MQFAPINPAIRFGNTTPQDAVKTESTTAPVEPPSADKASELNAEFFTNALAEVFNHPEAFTFTASKPMKGMPTRKGINALTGKLLGKLEKREQTKLEAAQAKKEEASKALEAAWTKSKEVILDPEVEELMLNKVEPFEVEYKQNIVEKNLDYDRAKCTEALMATLSEREQEVYQRLTEVTENYHAAQEDENDAINALAKAKRQAETDNSVEQLLRKEFEPQAHAVTYRATAKPNVDTDYKTVLFVTNSSAKKGVPNNQVLQVTDKNGRSHTINRNFGMLGKLFNGSKDNTNGLGAEAVASIMDKAASQAEVAAQLAAQ